MKAIFSVVVAGKDITAALNPILIDLSVSDRAGSASDSASITLDDSDGQIVMPAAGDLMEVKLGWEHSPISTIFLGKVSSVKADGSRSGRTLSVQAAGFDPQSKARQQQRLHFDDATVEHALSVAGKTAGISISVDPAFASIIHPYISLDDESFIAFGERLAVELGGTFKINGNTAVLAKRSGGSTPAGLTLPTVSAVWGVNLHNFSVEPARRRMVVGKVGSRHYDRGAAQWKVEETETGTSGGDVTAVGTFSQPDAERAREQSASDATEYDRQSGTGTVTIEGNLDAQPEGLCILIGCRPGIDGTYRIDSVDHSYSRSGWTTTLQLKQPKGDAGKDNR